jgi:hypothetical protein
LAGSSPAAGNRRSPGREARIGWGIASAELEAKSEKSTVSPGRLLPTYQLLGDMFMEHGKPAEALGAMSSRK